LVYIDIKYKDESENLVSIRGSPYHSSFSKDVDPKNNDIKGPLLV